MADDKLKLLYLMQLLLEETDPKHPLNATQLCERMDARYGLKYARKTVYADVSRLKEYGMQIGQTKGSSFGYYIEQRTFTLPELKLLVDAVQSSKFITKKRSEELIGKLEQLTSRENGKQLQRQVYIYNRIKADNDAIYNNVDTIHAAIRDNRQICFKYCEWNVKKELVRKKNGADYIVSPWSLTWDDENYYLVGYDAEAGLIKHYRVDKMQEITEREDLRLGREHFQNFDLAAFARKTFGMFTGEERSLTLECDNEFVGVIIDRFGTDVMIIPHGTDRFHVHVTVAVSPQFFGWLTGIGKGIRIVRPVEVKEAYRGYLKGILEEI
ncbi:MAG: WYL domain-containing protein [Eubacterium sp.]|nr:WYL domain-containing protein [Eubacterium sp.]